MALNDFDQSHCMICITHDFVHVTTHSYIQQIEESTDFHMAMIMLLMMIMIITTIIIVIIMAIMLITVIMKMMLILW